MNKSRSCDKNRKGCCEVVSLRKTFVNDLLKQIMKKYGKHHLIDFGSVLCSSDYDISLAGPNTDKIIIEFNKRFKEIFGMSSAKFFDTNVYGIGLDMYKDLHPSNRSYVDSIKLGRLNLYTIKTNTTGLANNQISWALHHFKRLIRGYKVVYPSKKPSSHGTYEKLLSKYKRLEQSPSKHLDLLDAWSHTQSRGDETYWTVGSLKFMVLYLKHPKIKSVWDNKSLANTINQSQMNKYRNDIKKRLIQFSPSEILCSMIENLAYYGSTRKIKYFNRFLIAKHIHSDMTNKPHQFTKVPKIEDLVQVINDKYGGVLIEK